MLPDALQTGPGTPADGVVTDGPLAGDSVLELEAAQPKRRIRKALPFVVPGTIAVVVFLTAWYVGSTYILSERRQFLLPPPQKVLTEGLLDSAAREQMLPALWETSKIMGTGLFISLTFGIALAVLMSQAKWIERAVYPWAVVLQTIPVLALVPLIGFWFGFDTPSRVIICTIISLFPIITNTLFGLQAAENALHDLFTLTGAGRWTRLVKLQFPAALPGIFTGLRISAGLSLIGAIVGDFFFRQGPAGIGRLLDVYRANLDSEKLFAAIILSCSLGVAVFLAFSAIGDLATRSWRTTGGRRS